MKPVFVTTCHPTYQRAWIFPTLARLGSCRVVCLLDPADTRELPPNCERHPFTGDRCYQDGRFLDAMPGAPDDAVVILADADALVQRDFDAGELATFDRLKDGFALGYNKRPGQTGVEEYALLRPRQEISEAARVLGVSAATLRGAWVYNFGLAAARAGTWRQLRTLYATTVGDHGVDLFDYMAWMQYLICVTLHHRGIPVEELGYATHAHGHFGLPDGCRVQGGKLYYRDRLVFFAHFCGITS